MQTTEDIQQTASREARLEPSYVHFLDAWKRAVVLAGHHLFSLPNKVENATHYHQLPPYLDKIRRALPNKSRQDAAFLGVLASFFNAAEGQKLLNKAGCTFGDVATVLSPTQRRILADLLTHYQGW
jgi:hypothetical protein